MKLVLIFLLFVTNSFAADINEVFSCKSVDGRVNLYLGENGYAEIGDESQSFSGTYTYKNQIEFQFPNLGYSDLSTKIEKRNNFITTFSTSNLFCHAIAHAKGEAFQGKVECPKIKYIPSAGYQINYFEFYQNHMVRRFTKDIILVGNGDTIFTETYGIYTVKGNKVWMFFGQEEKERELTGTVTDSGLIVNELEPHKGACQ